MKFVAAACNRHVQSASWHPSEQGFVAFGTHHLVALWRPLLETYPGVICTLRGHSAPVTCVKWFPDVNEFVSASIDATLRIWKTVKDEFKCVQVLRGHQGPIHTLDVFSQVLPNKEVRDILVSGSADGTLRVWSQLSGQQEFECLQVLELNKKYALSAALCSMPESNLVLLAVGLTDSKIILFALNEETKQFEQKMELAGHTDWVRCLSFGTMNNGDVMLASGSQDKYIRLWCCSKVREDAKLSCFLEDSVIESLSTDLLTSLEESMGFGAATRLTTKAHSFFSPNGQYQYTFNLEAILIGHEDWVLSLAWAPSRSIEVLDANGTTFTRRDQPLRLLSTSSDKSLMIWEPNGEEGVWLNAVQVGNVGGHQSAVYGAQWSFDSKTIISHGVNGAFEVWKRNRKESETHEQQSVELWEPSIGLSAHFGRVKSVRWDPTYTYLLSVSHDQTARIFGPWIRYLSHNVETWHELARPQVHGYDLQCMAFVDHFRYVCGSEGEKVIRAFDMTKSCLNFLESMTQTHFTSTDKNKLPMGATLPALGLSNKPIMDETELVQQSGDISGNEKRIEIMQHANKNLNDALNISLVQPPYEQHLIQYTLWPEFEKLYGHGYEVFSLAVSHDCKTLASGCRATSEQDAVIRIWNVGRDGNWCERQSPIQSHNLTITCLRFSWNDRWLLSAGRDRRWSLSMKTEDSHSTYSLYTYCSKAHARIIWDAAWSCDDSFFVTASRDKTVRIWLIHDPSSPCASLTLPESATSIALSSVPIQLEGEPDYVHLMAVGLEDGTIVCFSSVVSSDQHLKWTQLSIVNEKDFHAAAVTAIDFRVVIPSQINSSSSQAHWIEMVTNEYSGRFKISEFVKDVQLQLASSSDDGSVRLHTLDL